MILLEDVLKMSWRRFSRHLEDVLKTSYEDVRLRRTNSSWSKRLQKSVFRRRRWKMSSSRRMFAGKWDLYFLWVFCECEILQGVALIIPPGNEMSWQCCNNALLYVPAALQVRLKWNTQQRLSATLPRRLKGTSSQSLIGMSWRCLKGT